MAAKISHSGKRLATVEDTVCKLCPNELSSLPVCSRNEGNKEGFLHAPVFLKIVMSTSLGFTSRKIYFGPPGQGSNVRK